MSVKQPDMSIKPDWFPLSVDAMNGCIVRDANGEEFALASSLHNAALIILLINKVVKANFSS